MSTTKQVPEHLSAEERVVEKRWGINPGGVIEVPSTDRLTLDLAKRAHCDVLVLLQTISELRGGLKPFATLISGMERQYEILCQQANISPLRGDTELPFQVGAVTFYLPIGVFRKARKLLEQAEEGKG